MNVRYIWFITILEGNLIILVYQIILVLNYYYILYMHVKCQKYLSHYDYIRLWVMISSVWFWGYHEMRRFFDPEWDRVYQIMDLLLVSFNLMSFSLIDYDTLSQLYPCLTSWQTKQFTKAKIEVKTVT